MRIGNCEIGYGYPPLVSVDLSLNHGGDVTAACEMAVTAIAAGAHAVKIQFVRAYELIGHTQAIVDLYRRHELSADDVADIAVIAEGYVGVTPASAQGVRDVILPDYWKVASDMVRNAAMIAAMRETRRPLVISTGHLPLNEVGNVACKQDIVLHCVSEYPAMHPTLWPIRHLQELGYLTGYSHHSPGIEECLRAAELGAVFLEVHLKDRPEYAVDEWALTARQLEDLCKRLS